MQQVQVFDRDDVRLAEVPEPECGADDVVVAVAACGICGSDFGYIHAGGSMGPASEPMPLGHEFAGRIVHVGARISTWRVGQHVVVNPMSAANLIGNGGPDGAFAPWVRVRGAEAAGTLYSLPDEVPLDHGAVAEPLAVAFHAVKQGGAGPSTQAIVLGAGPIGLACVIGLKRAGVKDVVVLERSAHRRELACRLGADAAHADMDDALWKTLAERHGAVSFYGQAHPATDLFIDCSGASPLIEEVVQRAAPAARVVLVSVYKQRAALDLTLVMAKELQIRGALSYGDSFPDAIDHLARHGDAMAPYISHRVPLSRFHDALALARDPERAAKVLVIPG